MTYQCELFEQAPQPTLSVRVRTPVQGLAGHLGRVYGAIAGYLAGQGQQPAGAPFTAYYNMDMQDLDVEIGFPVASALPGQGEIQAGQLAGGKLARVIHIGPYDDVGPAYEALTQFVAEQSAEPAGVAYEFYLNDPTQTPPEALQTMVVFPLKSAA